MLSQRDKKALLQLYELKGEAILYTSSETTKALPQGTDYVSEGYSRPLAQINAVAKTYSALDGHSVRALDLINFNINNGQFIAVVGPSGCGKSTLLQMMAGAIAPSEGQILIAGEPVKGPRPDVGVVFQDPVLLPWRNVIQNVLLPAALRKIDKPAVEQRAQDLLKLVGINGFDRKYPNELSGGMQQRVGIARGLLLDPKILLLDEPFGALDAMTREHMNVELQAIWAAAHKTVLLITHGIDEAVFLADRVMVMSARPGRIVRIHDIDLPRPRTVKMMASPEFQKFTQAIRDDFNGIAGRAL